MSTAFFGGCIAALSLTLPVYLYRAVKGPSLFDRLIGLNGIATKSILILVFIGAFIGQMDMMIDIALGYGMINFVGAVATGQYLARKGGEE